MDVEKTYRCSQGHYLKKLEVKNFGPNHGKFFIAADNRDECGSFFWFDNFKGGNIAHKDPKKESSAATPATKIMNAGLIVSLCKEQHEMIEIFFDTVKRAEFNQGKTNIEILKSLLGIVEGLIEKSNTLI